MAVSGGVEGQATVVGVREWEVGVSECGVTEGVGKLGFLTRFGVVLCILKTDSMNRMVSHFRELLVYPVVENKKHQCSYLFIPFLRTQIQKCCQKIVQAQNRKKKPHDYYNSYKLS